MNIREKLRKKTAITEMTITEPLWVSNGSKTTALLYASAHSEYSRIRSLIISGKATIPKSRWLVRATIAAQAGFDRSLINPRRQLSICEWIDQKNLELDGLYSIHKNQARSTIHKTRAELEKEISYLRKQYAERTESGHRALVEAFFSSNMLDDRDSLRQENSRLRIENRHLSDTVAQLQHILRDGEIKLAQLWEALEPGQRIKLGWRPPQT